jgi:hypothetical protein
MSTIYERKNKFFFDKKGNQILVGDLLKIYHFRTKSKIYYMYHHVVLEQTEDFPVMAIQSYISDKPHCRLYVICNNRIYYDAEIIHKFDYKTKRLKIKVINQ